jgi:SAM-dependent methyltransferase
MSLKSIQKIYTNISPIGKILFLLAIFLLTISICKLLFSYEPKSSHIEGFDTQIVAYDKFYASIYDFIAFDADKNKFEIDKFVEFTNPNATSVILDIGSGMGHHVKALSDDYCGDIIGVDKSPDMINFSKKLYPDLSGSFLNIDITTGSSFPNQHFSHILCLYFTIYYIDNQKMFLQNCFNWLQNDGYMILHLVDKKSITTLLKPDYVNGITNEFEPKTTIDFNKFQYTSKFEPTSDPNKILFNEEFSFKNGEKKNQSHNLNMNDQEVILNFARSVGFIVHGKIDMNDCNYENHYLYILKKPY